MDVVLLAWDIQHLVPLLDKTRILCRINTISFPKKVHQGQLHVEDQLGSGSMMIPSVN